MGKKPEKYRPLTIEEYIEMMREVNAQKPKPSEEPEPFFYCRWGGIAWKCSDCKRNHKNSVFRTEDIQNWYDPWHNASFLHCDGYLPEDGNYWK